MDLFIASAWAQAAPAGPEQNAFAFLPLVILFVVFYLFLIRPQVKRQKEHQKLVQALSKGDEIVSSGGVAGRLVRAARASGNARSASSARLAVQ